jgi:hypothetical protein
VVRSLPFEIAASQLNIVQIRCTPAKHSFRSREPLLSKVTVVSTKTLRAGAGRTIHLNGAVLTALMVHARWYARRFCEAAADWFVFPGGDRWQNSPW